MTDPADLWLEAAPLARDLAVAVGVVGAVVGLWGGRRPEAAWQASVLASGAVLAWWWAPWQVGRAWGPISGVPLDGPGGELVRTGLALLGAAAAGQMWRLHRRAGLAVMGAMLGGTAALAFDLGHYGGPSAVVMLVAALASPWVVEAAPRVSLSVVGAALVLWATGIVYANYAWVALAAIGLALQWVGAPLEGEPA